MKKTILAAFISLSVTGVAQAPWSGINQSGDSYRFGNVGIGTSTPEKQLHINNTGDAILRLHALNGAGRRWDLMSSGGTSALVNSGYFGIIDVVNNNRPRLIINHSGFIGLGDAFMPERRLHLKDSGDAFIRLQAVGNNGRKWDIMSSGGASLLNSGDFGIIDVTNNKPRFVINMQGNVGIGVALPGNTFKLDVNGQTRIGVKSSTAHTNAMLTVDGKVVCKDLYVTAASDWPDFVFEKNYQLANLYDVRAYYEANKHLPNVPTACEIEEKGINMSEMSAIQMQKIEELTIYIIQLKEELDELKNQLITK